MTMNNLLVIISKRHDDWIKMVLSFGADIELANDIVQSMYIRIFDLVKDPDRIMYNETEVNGYFIFTLLRNRYLSIVNKKSKIDYNYDMVQYEEVAEYEENDIQTDYLLKLINEEINTWSWYDSKIYNLYYYEGYTIKKLSDETGISVSSIFNTLKTCRLKIKSKFNNLYYVNLSQ